jgi:hypothetical protein
MQISEGVTTAAVPNDPLLHAIINYLSLLPVTLSERSWVDIRLLL